MLLYFNGSRRLNATELCAPGQIRARRMPSVAGLFDGSRRKAPLNRGYDASQTVMAAKDKMEGATWCSLDLSSNNVSNQLFAASVFEQWASNASIRDCAIVIG